MAGVVHLTILREVVEVKVTMMMITGAVNVMKANRTTLAKNTAGKLKNYSANMTNIKRGRPRGAAVNKRAKNLPIANTTGKKGIRNTQNIDMKKGKIHTRFV